MNISDSLLKIVDEPSTRPIPESIRTAGDFLVQKYGMAVQGILLYGSCLRMGTDQDGLVDCYVLVDQYAAVYSSFWQALLNRWLPPNVFYGETDFKGRTVRLKYAMLSLADFERGVSPQWFHSYFWARFAQPTVYMAVSNSEVHRRIIKGLARAPVTFMEKVLPQMPKQFLVKDLWCRGLSLSYGAELRAEPKGRIPVLWDSHSDYFERLSHAAFLAHFPQIGLIAQTDPSQFCLVTPRWEKVRNTIGWVVRKFQGKILSILRLMKAAFTFQGGADYLIWKIERHSGVKIQLTPAQRRHPIWAGLTTFWRLYRQGAFR